jgi:hypothetical protein
MHFGAPFSFYGWFARTILLVVDVEALVGVVNELKAKLNTLINDVLGVEHSIDNIHNYDDTNIKEDLKEINE